MGARPLKRRDSRDALFPCSPSSDSKSLCESTDCFREFGNNQNSRVFSINVHEPSRPGQIPTFLSRYDLSLGSPFPYRPVQRHRTYPSVSPTTRGTLVLCPWTRCGSIREDPHSMGVPGSSGVLRVCVSGKTCTSHMYACCSRRTRLVSSVQDRGLTGFDHVCRCSSDK